MMGTAILVAAFIVLFSGGGDFNVSFIRSNQPQKSQSVSTFLFFVPLLYMEKFKADMQHKVKRGTSQGQTCPVKNVTKGNEVTVKCPPPIPGSNAQQP